MKKITVPLLKQRNPLVAPTLFRKAGKHRDGRQARLERAIRREHKNHQD